MRVAAYKELLARGLGSPDLTVKHEHGEEDARPRTALDSGRARLALGVPFENLPPACQAALREAGEVKAVESRVVDDPPPAP